MMGAVENPRFGCPGLVDAAVVIRDAQPEWPELESDPGGPQHVADHSEIFLEVVRDGVGNQWREAKRCGVDEIVAVDLAKIDPAAEAVGDHVHRGVKIGSHTQRLGKAVCGAER